MRLIKLAGESDGAHAYCTISVPVAVPDGWAVILDDMELANFPYGTPEAALIDDVMTVTNWTPGTIPEEEEGEAELTSLSKLDMFLNTLRADVDYTAAMTGVELDEPIFESAKKHYPEYWAPDRLEKLREKNLLSEEEYESLVSGDYLAEE